MSPLMQALVQRTVDILIAEMGGAADDHEPFVCVHAVVAHTRNRSVADGKWMLLRRGEFLDLAQRVS